jgi:hypothetical protein
MVKELVSFLDYTIRQIGGMYAKYHITHVERYSNYTDEG